jgi:ubiquinone/menaquinone biosynthesis C-methylase UbiE
MDKKTGDGKSFDVNWRNRAEASYLHWTRGQPSNQIQLAFRRHWITFNKIIESGLELTGSRCLEVGCGRGSLSAYFADAGWDCSLIDLSPSVINLAKDAFDKQGLRADFRVGNCLDLPYGDNYFDLLFSIGLLEHFEEIEKVLKEQIRVLKPGGLFLGYVVPESNSSIQSEYQWFNEILKECLKEFQRNNDYSNKTDIYRSSFNSDFYLNKLKKLELVNCKSSGLYSLPMISNSIEFPFTLLTPSAEKIIVEKFNSILSSREIGNIDPWLCAEDEGQAFLVWGWKKF